MKRTKMKQKDIYCSGTFGDTFIVFCKIYGNWLKNNKDTFYKLYRISNSTDFDKPLSAFFENIPFIDYITPALDEENMEKIDKNKYVGVGANGKAFPEEMGDDPEGFEMHPFPEVFIESKNLEGKNVGIQLHSGKPFSNFKAFDLKWIRSIVEKLRKKDNKINIYIF